MSAILGLKLVNAKRPQQTEPIVQRRIKLSTQLWEQIQLATCLAEGKSYAPTRTRTIVDKQSGERKTADVPKRVKPWWFVAENGRVCLQVRYGSCALEFAKGKNSIEVGTENELLAVMQKVRIAVDAGELDNQIDAARAAVRARFVK